MEKTLGQLIKEAREKEFPGHNQMKVAAQLGVSRSLLSQWESDKHFPRKHHLNRLAETLRISREDLSQVVVKNTLDKLAISV